MQYQVSSSALRKIYDAVEVGSVCARAWACLLGADVGSINIKDISQSVIFISYVLTLLTLIARNLHT